MPLLRPAELCEPSPPRRPFSLSVDALCSIMPRLGEDKARAYILPLVAAMAAAEIETPARAGGFLAQLAHESNQLRHWVEGPHDRVIPGCSYCAKHGPHAAGVQYEWRASLGNVLAGDGVRYLGRGPIQLTGRANYAEAGRQLGVDLVRSPDLAATPAVGFRVAAWYWQSHGCNALADAGDFREITKKINGGLIGLEDRERYWAEAKRVLGVE